MEAGSRCGVLYYESQQNRDVHEYRIRQTENHWNEHRYFWSGRGRLLLERDGHGCQETIQRGQRDFQVLPGGSRQVPGNDAGNHRYQDCRTRGGNHWENGTGRGADYQRPAGPHYCPGRHVPSFHGGAGPGTAYYNSDWAKPPWRNKYSVGFDLRSEIRIPNDRPLRLARVGVPGDNKQGRLIAQPSALLPAGRRRVFLRGGM